MKKKNFAAEALGANAKDTAKEKTKSFGGRNILQQASCEIMNSVFREYDNLNFKVSLKEAIGRDALPARENTLSGENSVEEKMLPKKFSRYIADVHANAYKCIARLDRNVRTINMPFQNNERLDSNQIQLREKAGFKPIDDISPVVAQLPYAKKDIDKNSDLSFNEPHRIVICDRSVTTDSIEQKVCFMSPLSSNRSYTSKKFSEKILYIDCGKEQINVNEKFCYTKIESKCIEDKCSTLDTEEVGKEVVLQQLQIVLEKYLLKQYDTYNDMNVDIPRMDRGSHFDILSYAFEEASLATSVEVNRNALSKLAQRFRRCNLKPGTLIVTQGKASESFFVCIDGILSVTNSQGIQGHVNGPCVFGESGLITSYLPSLSIQNISAAEIWCLPRIVFRNVMALLSAKQRQEMAIDSDIFTCKSSDLSNCKSGSEMNTEVNIESNAANVYPLILINSLEPLLIMGSGNYGKVFLAVRKHSNNFDTLYAVKRLKKKQLVIESQVENLLREKKAMTSLRHPFILRLHNTAQDHDHVFLIMDLIQGGELWHLVYQSKTIDRNVFGGLHINDVRFYLTNVIVALRYIHKMGFMFRDIKPENLLLSKKGYLKMIDFGFSKRLKRFEKSYTLCGTPEYIAPEMVLGIGHDHAVDFWAVGVLAFELLFKRTPFGKNDEATNEKFVSVFGSVEKTFDSLEVPWEEIYASKSMIHLIENLLISKPSFRIGMRPGKINDILQHEYFNNIDWSKVETMTYKAPHIPYEMSESFLRSKLKKRKRNSSSKPKTSFGWNRTNKEDVFHGNQSIFKDF
eukprot:g4520.t1